MAIIENFSTLSQEELKEFVDKLIKTINTEQIFADNAELTLDTQCAIETSDFDGNLYIPLECAIDVERFAKWDCGSPEERFDMNSAYNLNFDNSIIEDAKKSFKTLSTTLEGYNVSLELDDVDDDGYEQVEVDSYSEADAGIGEYEFWGHKSYDSQPYCEVEGTITKSCTCYITLCVEPI